MQDNRLRFETSPYLLQHADNPVDWRPWGKAALDEARETNRPILLSVGYAACHWCHVMAHESFEDEAIAERMNTLFVNIKVDREERPDIDSIYQNALALMGIPGGWPLTMFLTPDGEPFWGGTYFPAAPAHGRPGFADVLERISGIYHANPDAVNENRTALLKHLKQINENAGKGPIAADMLDQVAQKLLNHLDQENGGLGGAPKFPQPIIFDLLWRAYIRTGNTQFADAVTLSLTHMAQGGLYDHLGGGFSRYCVDERWHVPHFEKMLNDNAQLVMLYSSVWRETKAPLYARRVAETMDWLAREMLVEGGGFASSLDADSDGVEGKFYIWDKAEIAQYLDAEDVDLFCETYGVTDSGNWENSNVLHRLNSIEPLSPDEEERLSRCRTILFREREDRDRPARDDKVLADWNGMMIAAAAYAGQTFERTDWVDLACDAFAFVERFLSADDTRLWHATRQGRLQRTSLLDDHAHMIRAALILEGVTGNSAYLDRALSWCKTVESLFHDPEKGGYFTTASDADALIIRPKSVHDTAQPSANGVMLENYARLFLRTNDTVWQKRAEALLHAFSAELSRNFFPLAGFLNGYDYLLNGQAISLHISPESPQGEAYISALNTLSLPSAHAYFAPDTDPENAALICSSGTCSPPLKSDKALLEEARQRRMAVPRQSEPKAGGSA